MPKMIPMQATVAFERHGKMLQPGEAFSALPIEAASLRFLRKAAFMTSAPASRPVRQTRALEPDPDSGDNSVPMTAGASGQPRMTAAERRAAARNRRASSTVPSSEE